MAMLTDNNHSISNPNPTRRASPDSVSKRSNTQASAYAVDAGTMALTGFHFSTTSGAGGMCSISTPRPRAFHTTNTHLSQDWGGAFEALSGVPSPPPSPDAAAAPSPRLGFKAGRSSSGKGDVGGAAAHHITGECERLFCETLKAVFLVERDTGLENSLVVDARKKKKTKNKHIDDDEGARTPFQEHDLSSPTSSRHDSLPTPSPSPHEGWLYPAPPPPPSTTRAVHVAEYVEAWDYAGGARFRGFVAGRDGEEHHRAMFIFFDKEVIGKDLKPGYVSLPYLQPIKRA